MLSSPSTPVDARAHPGASEVAPAAAGSTSQRVDRARYAVVGGVLVVAAVGAALGLAVYTTLARRMRRRGARLAGGLSGWRPPSPPREPSPLGGLALRLLWGAATVGLQLATRRIALAAARSVAGPSAGESGPVSGEPQPTDR
jgi:hypothetical protein